MKALTRTEEFPSRKAIIDKCREFHMPFGWGIDRKVLYVKNKIELKKALLQEFINNYFWDISLVFLVVLASDTHKEIEKLKRYLHHLKDPVEHKGRITDEDIERAKEFPIGELVEVNRRGFARCINHSPDNNPSMWCKSNRVKCFSCQWSGSTIDVYMKLHDVDFIKAVKELKR